MRNVSMYSGTVRQAPMRRMREREINLILDGLKGKKAVVVVVVVVVDTA